MTDSVNKVQNELESSGYQTHKFNSPVGDVVAFNYRIEAGSYRGEEITVGVSFQDEGYPEYPPHWIHVNPPISDGKGGSIQNYEREGRQWLAMSRPPGKLWDQLRTRHIQMYISEHLRGIWKDV